MEPATVICCAAKFIPNVLEIAGVIEGVSTKLDKLTRAELNAGVRALRQASQSEKEAPTLLREARARFNKAVDLEGEDPVRLGTAYLGLALCHFHLGDCTNARECLDQIVQLSVKRPIASSEKRSKVLKFCYLTMPAIAIPLGVANAVHRAGLEARAKQLALVQDKGRLLLTQVLGEDAERAE